MKRSVESIRLKEIREELGLTQEALGDLIGLNKSTADMELGRVKVNAQTLLSLQAMYNINPLWIFGESQEKYIKNSDKSTLPKTLTVNNEGKENILLVDAKAAAGYANNLENNQFFEKAPQVYLPLPEFQNQSFRGFQIEGDSMYPLLVPGDWVFATAVDNVSDIKDGEIYVVVETNGIRIKKIESSAEPNTYILSSINPDYKKEVINSENIMELWKYYGLLSRRKE